MRRVKRHRTAHHGFRRSRRYFPRAGIGGLTLALALRERDSVLHHLDWIHDFDALADEPDERQGGTWL
ncbi:hypothetical protein [Burkholderia ambifaria]|uniref:Uncharacterized protein n=1 Tax=Burkholderia ambifaria MEX-5 TaxID=396597 RepID=B1T850_9BURK|nr:hypothetical protein [Burkholderia ambifaria]EDT40270.1 hypothetical protein BamMEX5DRAFT_3966 [Burkholderia ambifaria MEX-5]